MDQETLGTQKGNKLVTTPHENPNFENNSTNPNFGNENFGTDYSKLDGTIPFLKRKLQRSKSDKVLFGVLGGIGETYGIDPNVLRILFLISMLFPGPQILIYIAAAVLMWNT